MTDKAKPSGLQTDMEQVAASFESLLTSEEEQTEDPQVELEANETVEEEIIDDEEEAVEEQQLDSEDDEYEETETLEEEQDDEEVVEEPQLYAININGEEVEVTLDELQSGYSRQRDYTRKTQELAAQRKANEQKQAELSKNENLYKELLPRLEAALNEGIGEEKDWEKLYAEDPIAYIRERDVHTEKKERLAAVQAEQQRLQQEAQAKHQEELAQYMSYGNDEILKSVPSWKDNKVQSEEKLAIRDYAIGLGFTEQELDKIYDYRLLMGFRDAMLYNKTKKATKKKPTQKASVRNRVAKPGSIRTKKSNTPLKRSQQRLAKSGKVEDLADIFEQII